MATYNFIRPNFSKENAEVEEYLLRLLNELDHMTNKSDTYNNSVYNAEYKTEVTEVYEDSSIEEEVKFNKDNAKGTYRKWKSGLAELWMKKDFIVGEQGTYLANYPDLFIDIPIVQVSVETSDRQGNHSLCLVAFGSGTDKSTPIYKLYSPFADLPTNQKIRIHYYATGRWK